MPSKKKKYNSRFPPARIKKIMQADEDVGKVAAVVPVIISRTLEIFVESLLKKASQVTRSRNARTLTPAHLKATIQSNPQFTFLNELVASVPEMQTETKTGDEDGNQQQASDGPSSYVSQKNPRRPTRVSTSSSSGMNRSRGRPRKSSTLKVSRRLSQYQEDSENEDEDEDDDENDDLDVDEESSCDNNNSKRKTTTTTQSSAPTCTPTSVIIPNPHPSVPSSVIIDVDDDYDNI